MSWIRAQCSALCGRTLRWKPGQVWKRCPRCGTLNYCPDGARPGMGPAALEDAHDG